MQKMWRVFFVGLAVSIEALRIQPDRIGGEPDNAEIVFDSLPPGPSCRSLHKFASANPDFALSRAIQKLGMEKCEYPVGGIGEKQFYSEALKGNAENSKRIQFLHISKAAGTFFCACGNNNGQNIGKRHDGGSNCHFLREDFPIWGSLSEENIKAAYRSSADASYHTDNCTMLDALYERERITFEGNENFLANEGSLCPQFNNVLVLRSPIHRLVSHIVMLQGSKKAKKETVDTIFEKWPLLSDNFMTRVIGGHSHFWAPVGSLSHHHLLKAIRTVHDFDHVLIQDQTLNSQIKHSLGWDCGASSGRHSSFAGGTQAMVDYFKKTWGDQDFQRLLDRNKLDMQLYDDARHISFARRIIRNQPWDSGL